MRVTKLKPLYIRTLIAKVTTGNTAYIVLDGQSSMLERFSSLCKHNIRMMNPVLINGLHECVRTPSIFYILYYIHVYIGTDVNSTLVIMKWCLDVSHNNGVCDCTDSTLKSSRSLTSHWQILRYRRHLSTLRYGSDVGIYIVDISGKCLMAESCTW